MARGLEQKERVFVTHYLRNGRNGTQAARAAGVEKNPEWWASTTLKKPKVAAEIERRTSKLCNKVEVETVEICLELKRILFSDLADAIDPETGAFYPIEEWPEDTRRALSSVDQQEVELAVGDEKKTTAIIKKVRLFSKVEAADRLLRTIGAYASPSLGGDESPDGNYIVSVRRAVGGD